MAARSIASLSISFGLVSIPIKLYSATETSSAIQFRLLGSDGSRLRQQYVSDGTATPPQGQVTAAVVSMPARFRPQLVGNGQAAEGPAASISPLQASEPIMSAPMAPTPAMARIDEDIVSSSIAAQPKLVERSEMLKGYEFEKGKFVTFTSDELKALQEGARETIDIVSFIPERSVDPIYFDKAYYLVPDKRGNKPYSLLLEAMRTTNRCALAKWAFKSKEYVVQIRPTEGGLVLQQMLYAEEVRSIADLGIDLVVISDAELKLAQQLIQQISADSYEPRLFVDEEKKRILSAVDRKIAGRQVIAPEHNSQPLAGQVIDLIAALRASLSKPPAPPPLVAGNVGAQENKPRQPARRSSKSDDAAAKGRSRKAAS